MAKDYSKCASQILEQVGGAKNVSSVTHCMTRLRFVLKDESVVDDAKVKGISGVMGVMRKGGQFQVIIGNDVAVCFKELSKLGNFSGGTDAAEKPKEKLTPKAIINNVLNVISGSMAPLLCVIIGCGMVKLLNIILDLAHVPADNSTYQLLTVLGDVAFYFLPILLAYTSAQKFRTNPVIAMTVVAVLIHPDLIAMLSGEQAVTFIGLPVTAASYSSTVLPALLITWVQSYVEKLIDKVTPGWTKTIFKPMLILIIMMGLGLVVLAPLGSIVGDVLHTALLFLQTKANWLTLMIFAGFMPFIVITGMHYAFFATSLKDMGTLGYETLLLPAMLAANLSQGAAALAVALRSKNKELKSVSGAAAVSALVAGTTEPALYGVTIPLKRPLIATCIGSGLAGLFVGIVNLKSYSFVSPSLLSIIQFINPDGGMNFVYALVGTAITVVATFVATLLLGWEDPAEEAGAEPEAPVKAAGGKTVIEPPIAGEVIPLDQVNDATFAEGILGPGFAVMPSEGKVYAPFDGTCDEVFDTLHAYGLTSESGVSVLIHIGLETVGLNGKPFKAHVKSGDRIRKGQLLAEFSIDEILAGGCETVTPVIVTNEDEVGAVRIENNRIVIGE